LDKDSQLGLLGLLLTALALLASLLYISPIFISLATTRGFPGVDLPFSLAWVLTWTILQATASASLSLLLGWPLGILAGYYRSRIAQFATVASLAPFMSPVVSVAIGLRTLYGRDGLLGSYVEFLNSLSSGWLGVIILNSYFNIGLIAVLVASSASSTERNIVEQMLLIGLRGLELWRKALLPLTTRPALYGWGIAFLYSFTSASPLLVEGARFRYYTIEAWLYTLYSGFPQRHSWIPFIALLELLLASLFSYLLIRFSEKIVVSPIGARGVGAITPRGSSRVLVTMYSIAVFAYLYLPILSLAGYATNADLSDLVKVSRIHGPGFLGSVFNSLLLGSIVVLLAIPLGLVAGEKKSLGVLALSTIAVAPVAYGVTASITYFRFLSTLLGALPASYLMTLLAHIAAALPLSSRVLAAGSARLQREVSDTMALLGIKGLEYLWHKLLAILPSTLAAIGFSLAASLGEFGASIVVTIRETRTLTALVYRIYGSGRFFEEAVLAALVLEALSLLVLILAITYSRRILGRSSYNLI